MFSEITALYNYNHTKYINTAPAILSASDILCPSEELEWGPDVTEVYLLTLQLNYSPLNKYLNNNHCQSRNSVVGIATSYGLDDRGVRVRVPVESRIFSSPNRSDGLWGPPNLLSNGYRGREADHSPPTSAEAKKMWICTSTPPYVFMA
jgi:hypothetical protein